MGLLLDDPFGQALERALAAAPDFDLTQALATLIRHELLVGVERSH